MPDGSKNKKTTKRLFLIVDDEEDIRLLLRGFLERAGSRVLTAKDAEEALRICHRLSCRIDALVTDVQLPGLSGFDLAELAARLRPEMPVLFISGSFRAREEAIARHLMPRRGFLQKPFTAEALSQKLALVMTPPACLPAPARSQIARAS